MYDQIQDSMKQVMVSGSGSESLHNVLALIAGNKIQWRFFMEKRAQLRTSMSRRAISSPVIGSLLTLELKRISRPCLRIPRRMTLGGGRILLIMEKDMIGVLQEMNSRPMQVELKPQALS